MTVDLDSRSEVNAETASGPAGETGGANLENRLPWTAMVAATGNAGRLWLQGFEATGARRITEAAREAVRLLRRRRLSAAETLLQKAGRELRALPSPGGSAALVAFRFHATAEAYLLYLNRDYAAAEERLLAAGDALRRAIDAAGFLLPLAHDHHELLLQRIRIARARRDWPGMSRLCDRLLGMMAGDRPLCVLADGRRVTVDGLRTFNLQNAPDAESEREILRVTDRERRLRTTRSRLRTLYALPGLVLGDPC